MTSIFSPSFKQYSLGLFRTLVVFGLPLLILVLSVRGLPGNPVITELSTPAWSYDGPFELSPERGRFALIYSLVENHSLIFDLAIAKLAIPDLAINALGQYVSLFAPGVSFLVVPGYVIGKFFGAAQVGTFAVIALFGLLNAWLVAAIAKALGAKWYSALLSGMIFLFATPAFAYATTLYQHHISVFLLLLAIWALLRLPSLGGFMVVWFACALSVVVDNPNLFLMFPVGLLALSRLFQSMNLKLSTPFPWKRGVLGVATFLAFVPPVAFFLWYNLSAYGNPFQLPGTLQSVTEIDATGKPVTETAYQKKLLTEKQLASLREGGNKEKTAVGFFKTRNLYNGFFIHTLSFDRGIIAFTPVLCMGIGGFLLLYRREKSWAAFFIATMGVNVLLYSMWGDPWGGWAFGSRYLIPTYALLAIGLALALSSWGKRVWFLALFIPLFLYSAGVNTLGALTTSTNPPKIQVLALEEQTGHEQKYTFLRNWEYLNQKYEKIGSKSFVYQAWATDNWSAPQYFFFVYSLVLLLGFGLLSLGYVLDEKRLRS